MGSSTGVILISLPVVYHLSHPAIYFQTILVLVQGTIEGFDLEVMLHFCNEFGCPRVECKYITAKAIVGATSK